MAVNIAPDARLAFFDSNGDPLSGAKLHTYAAGSTTDLATYTDSTGNTANANPIVLNSAGRTPNGVWLSEGSAYKFVLKDVDDVELWSEDNISGVNDTGQTSSQWIGSGATPTYVSATSFTVAGDKTEDFHLGRRIKATVSAGTVYGTIVDSAYTTLTTVTVTLDSGSLDNGLSVVELGLLTETNTAFPWLSVVTLLSDDAGATAGPSITGYRDSASPAADDALREDKYDGNDSAGNRTTYATLRAKIEDPTDASEDGALHYYAMEGGTLTDKGEVLSSGQVVKESGTISGTTDFTVTDLESGFDYFIHFDNLASSNDDVQLFIRTSTDNGATFNSSVGAYSWSFLGIRADAASVSIDGETSDTEIQLNSTTSGNRFGTVAGESASGVIRIFNPAASSRTFISAEYTHLTSSGNLMTSRAGGMRSANESNNAILLTFSSGNIASMNYSIRKIRRST